MITRHLLVVFSAAVLAPQVHATEDGTAKGLHDQHCVACHGTEVYTREDRKVDSLPGLERQVQRCETALELRWFDEEVSAVTGFLNDRFYRFKP